jgi:hypothetical protein
MFGDFQIGIIAIMVTGNPGIDNAFNYFFTIGVALGFLALVPVAIVRLLGRS